MRTIAGLALAATLLAIASACATPGTIPTVSFTAREFHFSGPDTVPAGLVRFELTNAGFLQAGASLREFRPEKSRVA